MSAEKGKKPSDKEIVAAYDALKSALVAHCRQSIEFMKTGFEHTQNIFLQAIEDIKNQGQKKEDGYYFLGDDDHQFFANLYKKLLTEIGGEKSFLDSAQKTIEYLRKIAQLTIEHEAVIQQHDRQYFDIFTDENKLGTDVYHILYRMNPLHGFQQLANGAHVLRKNKEGFVSNEAMSLLENVVQHLRVLIRFQQAYLLRSIELCGQNIEPIKFSPFEYIYALTQILQTEGNFDMKLGQGNFDNTYQVIMEGEVFDNNKHQLSITGDKNLVVSGLDYHFLLILSNLLFYENNTAGRLHFPDDSSYDPNHRTRISIDFGVYGEGEEKYFEVEIEGNLRDFPYSYVLEKLRQDFFSEWQASNRNLDLLTSTTWWKNIRAAIRRHNPLADRDEKALLSWLQDDFGLLSLSLGGISRLGVEADFAGSENFDDYYFDAIGFLSAIMLTRRDEAFFEFAPTFKNHGTHFRARFYSIQ